MSTLHLNDARSSSSELKQYKSDYISTAQNLDDLTSRLNPKSYRSPQREKDETNSNYDFNISRSVNKPKSLCSHSNAQAMTDTNSSFSIPTNNIEYKYKILVPAQLHQKIELQCPNCKLNGNKTCNTCQGKKKLGDESSLVKFFDYLLQFKLRQVQSYREQEIDRPIQEQIDTQNIRGTVRTSRTYKPQLFNRTAINHQIHYGYFCNSCNDGRPIRGPRHKCQSCQDFDLCDPCFNHWGHKHKMTSIAKAASFKFSQYFLSKMCWQQRKMKYKDDIRTSLIGQRVSALQKKILSSSIR